jgi:acetolactate synthase I/II/III large subunit
MLLQNINLKMKLSDYIIEFLAKKDIKYIFGITGVSAVHLFDSISKNPNVEYICPQHEQTAAMAADAYSRLTNNFGVAITTSGPGATNLVTGVCCSYFDSIPTLMITGQVPLSQCKKDSKIRQIGFQETDIVEMFKPVTKYSKLIEDPYDIRYELEKAIHIAKTERPGPVLLDIPDDLQRQDIDISKLREYIPETEEYPQDLDEKITNLINLIKDSERPIIILGGGIKLAKAEEKAKRLIEKLNFPVALTWATKDMLPHDYPLVIEGFGVAAERAGNFAVQNADLIIALGTRLDTHETGNDLSKFGREAKKVVLDIDNYELEKYEPRGMNIDLKINIDANIFLDSLLEKEIPSKNIPNWLDKIKEWRTKYPICQKEFFEQKEKVNPYVFLDELSKQSNEGDIILTDAGSNLTWTMQAFRIKQNQRLFSAFNHSPMGYSLSASIGAYFATKKSITCITGDGGIQMNIQELATIRKHNLPIKIFLFNNNGYGIIQQTQDTWLNSNYAASNPDKGVAIPDFIRISKAYDIPTITIKDHSELYKIRKVLNYSGPVLCNILINQHHKIAPKLDFGGSIEDPSPKLSRDEFNKNMIINPLEEG